MFRIDKEYDGNVDLESVEKVTDDKYRASGSWYRKIYKESGQQ